MPELSVIIVHHNTPTDLDVCLESLYHFTKGLSFEVIVVDNASTVPGIHEVIAKYPDVVFVRAGANLGFAKGCNLAAGMAKGEYLALLNPDAYVVEDTLTKTVCFMKRNAIELCGPRTTSAAGASHHYEVRFPTVPDFLMAAFRIDIAYVKNRIAGRAFRGVRVSEEVSEVDWVPGAALFISSALWRQLDGMDERIFLFGEDLDLCWRAKAGGTRVIVYEGAPLVHHYGRSATQNLARRIVATHAGKAYVINKHYGPGYSMLFLAAMLGTAIAKMMLFAMWAICSKRVDVVSRRDGYAWCTWHLLRSRGADLPSLLATRPKWVRG